MNITELDKWIHTGIDFVLIAPHYKCMQAQELYDAR